MKKHTRIIISLILVTLLVTALAAPALASEVVNFSGSWNREDFSAIGSIYHTEENGYAQVSLTSAVPGYVSAHATNKLYYDLEGKWGYSEKGINTGYINVTAMTDRLMEINNVTVRAEIKETYGILRVPGYKIYDDIPQEYYEYWGIN